jgi:Holliday junction resolvasome RuvABC DNA-binding subunit
VQLHREDYPLPIDRKNMSRLCTRTSIERRSRERLSLTVRSATSARACSRKSATSKAQPNEKLSKDDFIKAILHMGLSALRVKIEHLERIQFA